MKKILLLVLIMTLLQQMYGLNNKIGQENINLIFPDLWSVQTEASLYSSENGNSGASWDEIGDFYLTAGLTTLGVVAANILYFYLYINHSKDITIFPLLDKNFLIGWFFVTTVSGVISFYCSYNFVYGSRQKAGIEETANE